MSSLASFRCQHKGCSFWDTHRSFVTCRIRKCLFCSRDNPCHFYDGWDQVAGDNQNIRVNKMRRNWESSERKNAFYSCFPLTRGHLRYRQMHHDRPQGVSWLRLVQTRGCQPLNRSYPGFYYRLFLVPKPNQQWRFVFDPSLLNNYIRIPKFKMDTPQKIRSSLRKGRWVFSLD